MLLLSYKNRKDRKSERQEIGKIESKAGLLQTLLTFGLLQTLTDLLITLNG